MPNLHYACAVDKKWGTTSFLVNNDFGLELKFFCPYDIFKFLLKYKWIVHIFLLV